MTPGCQWGVGELLPHSGPLVLVDEVTEAGEDWVTATTRIGEDSLFFRHGKGVPVWVGLEYMAQTAALLIGIGARRRNEPVRVGLLLGTRHYCGRTDYFRLGSHLVVHVRQVWSDGIMAAFDCDIAADGACLAEAKLNCYQPPEFQAFLAEVET